MITLIVLANIICVALWVKYIRDKRSGYGWFHPYGNTGGYEIALLMSTFIVIIELISFIVIYLP